MQAKFLVCDDEKIRVQEIRKFLGTNPRYHILETFSSGREVADWVKRNPGKADVLILDIIMPAMDGYAAFFEIKQFDPKLKVFFVSVENSPPLVKELAKQGAAGFFPKPLNREKFLEGIRKIVGF
jgi:DNA-binding NarL/FixJ family response regulator